MMAGLRFTVAGVLLFAWVYFRNPVKIKLEHLKLPAITGTANDIHRAWKSCMGGTVYYLGFAALLCSVIPVWMVLISWMQSRANKPDKLTVAGIILGITGVTLLTVTGDEFSISTTAGSGMIIFNIIPLLLSGILWSYASIKSRKFSKELPLLYSISIQILPAEQLFCYSAFSAVRFLSYPLSAISFISFASMVYLSFIWNNIGLFILCLAVKGKYACKGWNLCILQPFNCSLPRVAYDR